MKEMETKVFELQEQAKEEAMRLQAKVAETETSLEELQKRFDSRESREDDLAKIAKRENQLRAVKTENKSLTLELQNQYASDKIFRGGERMRETAHKKDILPGKKLADKMHSFQQRR